MSVILNELYKFGFIMKSLCFPLFPCFIFTSLYLTYLLTPPPPQSLNIYLPYHSFPPSITIFPPSLELHFHQRGLSCKWGEGKENGRRSLRRRAAIKPETSRASKRLVYLPGSNSEEGMEIDCVSYKIQPSDQIVVADCIFKFSAFRLHSRGINRFHWLWNVITVYKWLQKVS